MSDFGSRMKNIHNSFLGETNQPVEEAQSVEEAKSVEEDQPVEKKEDNSQ